jgi:uncharacterized protein YbaR (Trm112 family)
MTETRMSDDEMTLEPAQVAEVERGRALTLDECVELLASPDSHSPLRLAGDGRALVNAKESFPVVDGLPLLFPSAVLPFVGPSELAIPAGGSDALRKYLHLSSMKFDREPTNSEHTDVNYLKHVYRARTLMREARGTVVDVGCDSPRISRSIFPSTTQYIGLEPTYEDRSEFRIIGMAEFLPFRDGAVDNVAIMTTLDHVLDYHVAIDEAWRILRPGGTLFLATLIWTHDAELYHDHVHFHHFRDFEILGALRRFSIQELRRYPWKGNTHRFGWYLSATK